MTRSSPCEGYRRFLATPDDDHFVIDRAKAEEDAKFDGIFVLRTNTDLAPLDAMLCYKRLWMVERAFLDYCLIFGHFGLPALGFNGAAYASVIAEAAGMVVVLAVIRQKGIGKQFQLAKSWRFDPVNTRLILVQSSPLIFQYAISIISWEFFYILVEHHGQRDLAISNAMRNIFGSRRLHLGLCLYLECHGE